MGRKGGAAHSAVQVEGLRFAAAGQTATATSHRAAVARTSVEMRTMQRPTDAQHATAAAAAAEASTGAGVGTGARSGRGERAAGDMGGVCHGADTAATIWDGVDVRGKDGS
jgi:hypothetical protein